MIGWVKKWWHRRTWDRFAQTKEGQRLLAEMVTMDEGELRDVLEQVKRNRQKKKDGHEGQ